MTTMLHDDEDTLAEVARLRAMADEFVLIASECTHHAEAVGAEQVAWADEWRPDDVHTEVTAAFGEALNKLAVEAGALADGLRADAAVLEQRVSDVASTEAASAASIDAIDTSGVEVARPASAG